MEENSSEFTQYRQSNLAGEENNPYSAFDAWKWIQQISLDVRRGTLPTEEMFTKILGAWPDKEMMLRWKKSGYSMDVFSPHGNVNTELPTNAKDQVEPITRSNEDNNHEEHVSSSSKPHWIPLDTKIPVELCNSLYTLGYIFELDTTSIAFNQKEETLLEQKASTTEGSTDDALIITESDKTEIQKEWAKEKEVLALEPTQSISESLLPMFIFEWSKPKVDPDDSLEKIEIDKTENRDNLDNYLEASEITDNLRMIPGETYTEWLLRLQKNSTTATELIPDKPVKLKKEKAKKLEKKARKKQKKEEKALKKAAKKAEDSDTDTPESVLNILQESVKFSPAVITETYADLMVAQGYIDKAKEMYNELMLRNPEKSSYFAAKIKELN